LRSFGFINLPFQDTEPILEPIQKYADKRYIVKECELNRHKASELIKKELQPFLKENLGKDLEKYHFSIIIDESTDITRKKFLTIMVQFIHPERVVECKLLSFKECSFQADAEA